MTGLRVCCGLALALQVLWALLAFRVAVVYAPLVALAILAVLGMTACLIAVLWYRIERRGGRPSPDSEVRP